MSSEIPRLSLFNSSMAGKYKTLIFTLTIVSLIGLAVAGYSFYQYQTTQKELQAIKKAAGTSQAASGGSDQLSKILVEISKIMKLPEGEIPTMATISDISKLKDQPFFQNAKNGDVLLVFNKAGKAILYNPADKKIVEVAPVQNSTATSSPSGTPKPIASPSPSPLQAKILLRNGTAYPNLAAKMEGEIKKAFPATSVVGKENAARDTYDKTFAVLINPSAKDSASEITKKLGLSLGDLPSAEKKPTGVDILIILGKDKI